MKPHREELAMRLEKTNSPPFLIKSIYPVQDVRRKVSENTSRCPWFVHCLSVGSVPLLLKWRRLVRLLSVSVWDNRMEHFLVSLTLHRTSCSLSSLFRQEARCAAFKPASSSTYSWGGDCSDYLDVHNPPLDVPPTPKCYACKITSSAVSITTIWFATSGPFSWYLATQKKFIVFYRVCCSIKN